MSDPNLWLHAAESVITILGVAFVGGRIVERLKSTETRVGDHGKRLDAHDAESVVCAVERGKLDIRVGHLERDALNGQDPGPAGHGPH